jgi:predicted site-specific integrase-resolvase
MFIRVSELKTEELPYKFSKSTIYSWARRGKFPGVFRKVSGKLLVNVEELQAALEKQEN